jgi:hypothetical protein
MNFMNRDQWGEIYDKARQNGYSVTNFLVETVRRGLKEFPGYEPTNEQIVLKLSVLEEEIIYRLCMNKGLWPDV